MTTSLATLLVTTTKARIYQYAIDIATAVGLPTTTWQAGDPTRSQYHLSAFVLSKLEEAVRNYITSGFLDYATGVQLEILADQVFGVTVPSATYATTSVTLTNQGGGYYPDIAAGDITFRNSTTGKTYRNTSGGTLNSGVGEELVVSVVADEAGSDSSASAGEIDEIVAGDLLLVDCTNLTAAVGIDKQSDETTRQQCRDKLGALSPEGPKEAYSYVARNRDLTGASIVPRVRVYSDSDAGEVTVYLASPSGPITEPDRVLIEEAIVKWAEPQCITAIVLSAAAVVVPVTYSLWVYKSCNLTTGEIAELVEEALETLFAERPIGGDTLIVGGDGYLYKSFIESTILGVLPEAFRVSVSVPVGDTALGIGDVATLGTVTPTINLTVNP